jgi:hypothetical protein
MNNDDKWASAAIAISSSSMTPSQISNLLRIEPTNFHKKGSLVSERNINGPKRQRYLWLLDSKLPQTFSLEQHIQGLIEIIECQLEGFNEILGSCKCELYCGFSSGSGQGGFVLNSELLKRVASLSLDLVVDLYPPERTKQ